MSLVATRVAPEKAVPPPVLSPLFTTRSLKEKAVSAFWEKYKDPRWQKRRLQIMELAHFSCSDCGDDKTTLNVHHKWYRKGADPWDYQDDELVCLCAPCHEVFHESKDTITAILRGAESNLEGLAGLLAGYLSGNDALDPSTAEIGRQADPVFFQIGLAAAAIEHQVFCGNIHAAMQLLERVYSGKPAIPSAVKFALQDWKGANGQS